MSNIPDEPFAGSYSDAAVHKWMLQDVVRTRGYEEALRQVVRPGDRVIDFGTGSGVLAIFAARAGAGHVDAIERTGMARVAEQICRLNVGETVQVHHTDEKGFAPTGPADVLVSEWMGQCLFNEAMLGPLFHVRDKWLKPGGTLVPSRASVHGAFVIDDALYEDGSFLEQKPYGIDFGPFASAPLKQARIVVLEEDQVLSPYVDLGTLDLATLKEVPKSLSAVLSVAEPVTVYGFLAWFSVELAPGIEFATGPQDPPTHWSQIYCPFPEPLDLDPAREVTVRLHPPTEESSDPVWGWHVSDGLCDITISESQSRP